jgi:hypothetical protein
MGEKTFAVAVLVGLAFCHAAMADSRAERASRSTLARVAPQKIMAHAAAAHGARRSRPAPARERAKVPAGAPPGPGYCWYAIDRSTGNPGFWDLCRGR